MGKIIIPGEPEPRSSNALLSTELFEGYARSVIQGQLDFHSRLRIAELRKSAGVTEKAVVTVRIPPRYRELKDG